MRISDWSSDVCSSDLCAIATLHQVSGPFDGASELQRRCGVAHIDIAPPVLQQDAAIRRLIETRVVQNAIISDHEVAGGGACRTDAARLPPIGEAINTYGPDRDFRAAGLCVVSARSEERRRGDGWGW